MKPEHFRLLYDYNAWANHRVLAACGALTAEQLTCDLGSSHRSIRETLLHLAGGEWFWLERMQGGSPRLPSAEGMHIGDFIALRGRWLEINGKLLQFVGTRPPEELARVLHYHTTEGNPNSQPLWQMLQHVVNHGSYHRGQVTTMLRQLGAAPVATDLIAFYRENDGKTFAAGLDREVVRLLYEYNSWANRRVLDACAALNGEQLTRDLRSSFPSVRDTLAHILGVEWLWLERWHGRMPTAILPASQLPTLASIRERWVELEQHLLGFVHGLTDEDLAHVHEIRTTAGKLYTHPLWQMLQHLVNHGTYHRGQVATLLRQLGARPNYSDLIYFYRARAGQALD